MVFDLIFRHGWVFLLGINLINYFTLKSTSKKIISQKPDLENGYKSILNSYLIFSSIPWLIIGFGDLTSQITSIFDIFHPRTMNPVVIAFHLYIVMIMCLLVYWGLFRNGAKFLEKHPGVIQFRGSGIYENPTEAQIKRVIILCGIIAIGVLLSMWFSDFQIPKH